jgi:hypothetical protein
MDADFFCASWQDVFTAGLENSPLIAANAIRSLRHLGASVGVKILVISPDSEALKHMRLILKPSVTAMSVSLLTLIDDEPLSKAANV